MAAPGPSRSALVRESLLGVLEIAWDGDAAKDVQGFRAQASALPPQQMEDMLKGFVHLGDLFTLLQQAAAGSLQASPLARQLDGQQAAKVSRALEPLAELVGLPKGRDVVATLDPLVRAEVLLRAIGRAADPQAGR